MTIQAGPLNEKDIMRVATQVAAVMAHWNGAFKLGSGEIANLVALNEDDTVTLAMQNSAITGGTDPEGRLYMDSDSGAGADGNGRLMIEYKYDSNDSAGIWLQHNGTQAFTQIRNKEAGTDYVTMTVSWSLVQLDDNVSLYFEPRTGAPSAPVDGYVVFADGTSWDPGSGKGLYVRNGGAWVFLG